MASDAIVTLTDSTFEEEVLKSDVPVLVDFWAAWCGPCLRIAPIIEELATELAGKVKVGKLDVDENQQSAINYGVQSIPTLILFKDGKIADRIVGAVPKRALQEALRKVE
jgi:thioredoxin 1